MQRTMDRKDGAGREGGGKLHSQGTQVLRKSGAKAMGVLTGQCERGLPQDQGKSQRQPQGETSLQTTALSPRITCLSPLVTQGQTRA